MTQDLQMDSNVETKMESKDFIVFQQDNFKFNFKLKTCFTCIFVYLLFGVINNYY